MNSKFKFTSSFWLRSVFFTFLQRFSVIIFGFASTIILFRFFENSEMGVWALFLQIVPTIEMVKVGLLRNAMIKFLHLREFAEHKKEVQSASLIINILFSIVVSILLWFGAAPIAEFLKAPVLIPLLQISVIWVILLIPFNHCEIVQQANLQFKSAFIAYLLRQAIYFAGLVIMLIFFTDKVTFSALLYMQIGALLIASVFFLLVTKKYMARTFNFHWEIFRKLLHFGKYVFGTSLFSNLARFTDHFVTANAVGDPVRSATYVSYYNASSRIMSFVDLPTYALADVLFPKNAEAAEKEGTLKIRYYVEKSIGTNIALILPVCILLFVFAHYVVLLLVGERYLAAVPILQLTLVMGVLRPYFPPFGYTMDSIGKPAINFWVNTVSLVLNVGLTYLAYKYFELGLYGAAYAGLVSGPLTYAMVYYFLRKELDVRNRHVIHYALETYKQIFNAMRQFLSKSN